METGAVVMGSGREKRGFGVGDGGGGGGWERSLNRNDCSIGS